MENKCALISREHIGEGPELPEDWLPVLPSLNPIESQAKPSLVADSTGLCREAIIGLVTCSLNELPK